MQIQAGIREPDLRQGRGYSGTLFEAAGIHFAHLKEAFKNLVEVQDPYYNDNDDQLAVQNDKGQVVATGLGLEGRHTWFVPAIAGAGLACGPKGQS